MATIKVTGTYAGVTVKTEYDSDGDPTYVLECDKGAWCPIQEDPTFNHYDAIMRADVHADDSRHVTAGHRA